MPSTGPVSPEGKARASHNALSHGLTTKDLYVPAAQQEEFESMQQALQADLYPDSPAEFLLFHHIVAASWRLRRCDQAEAALAASSDTDPLLDSSLEPKLRTIDRARAQAFKMLHKSLAELRRIQTQHQYRDAAMPAGEGCDTSTLGLADSELVCSQLQRDIARRTQNELRQRRLEKAKDNDDYSQLAAELANVPALPETPDDDDSYENDPEFLAMIARADEVARRVFSGQATAATAKK